VDQLRIANILNTSLQLHPIFASVNMVSEFSYRECGRGYSEDEKGVEAGKKLPRKYFGWQKVFSN
jgi:hypothetical protein